MVIAAHWLLDIDAVPMEGVGAESAFYKIAEEISVVKGPFIADRAEFVIADIDMASPVECAGC